MCIMDFQIKLLLWFICIIHMCIIYRHVRLDCDSIVLIAPCVLCYFASALSLLQEKIYQMQNKQSNLIST